MGRNEGQKDVKMFTFVTNYWAVVLAAGQTPPTYIPTRSNRLQSTPHLATKCPGKSRQTVRLTPPTIAKICISSTFTHVCLQSRPPMSKSVIFTLSFHRDTLLRPWLGREDKGLGGRAGGSDDSKWKRRRKQADEDTVHLQIQREDRGKRGGGRE